MCLHQQGWAWRAIPIVYYLVPERAYFFQIRVQHVSSPVHLPRPDLLCATFYSSMLLWRREKRRPWLLVPMVLRATPLALVDWCEALESFEKFWNALEFGNLGRNERYGGVANWSESSYLWFELIKQCLNQRLCALKAISSSIPVCHDYIFRWLLWSVVTALTSPSQLGCTATQRSPHSTSLHFADASVRSQVSRYLFLLWRPDL